MQKSVKEERYLYIGGSDIPAILNISPFKSRFRLLQEKAQIVEDTFDGNAYTEYGNKMEAKIRDYINASYEDKFEEGKHIKDDIRIHTDGENNDTILEIKTTSQIHENVNDYKVYLVQLLFYMYNTGKSKGKLAVYERPKDFDEEFYTFNLQIFDIDINDYQDLVKEINDAVDLFRSDLQRIKENHELTEEDFIYIPEEVKKLCLEVEDIEEALSTFNELQTKQKQLKEALYNTMEKYGVKKWTTPNGVNITRVSGSEDKEVQKFDEKRFKEEHEEEYNNYLITTIQKGKKGSLRVDFKKEG